MELNASRPTKRIKHTIEHLDDYGTIYVSSVWQKHVVNKIIPLTDQL
jgi:hypothetical protein